MNAPPPLWGLEPAVKFDRLPRKARHLDGHSLSIPSVQSVAEINRWVNRNIEWRREKVDQWASPEETFQRRYGDCEDLALLKQALLRGQKVPSWVALVWDRQFRSHHAVCITSTQCLDSFGLAPAPFDAYTDYYVCYAFDDQATWVYGKKVDG